MILAFSKNGGGKLLQSDFRTFQVAWSDMHLNGNTGRADFPAGRGSGAGWYSMIGNLEIPSGWLASFDLIVDLTEPKNAVIRCESLLVGNVNHLYLASALVVWDNSGSKLSELYWSDTQGGGVPNFYMKEVG